MAHRTASSITNPDSVATFKTYVMTLRYPTISAHVASSAVLGGSSSTAARASASVTVYPSIVLEPWIALASEARRRTPVHRRGTRSRSAADDRAR